MSEFERKEHNTDRFIIRKDNEWVIERKDYDMVFDSILRIWKKGKVTVTYEPLNCWIPPLYREIEIIIYFSRYAISPETYKELSAVFSQKIRIEADKNNPNQYFNTEENIVFEHDLRLGITQPLSVLDPRFQKIGKEKRLTPKEVQEIQKKGIRIFEERGNELVINL